jgi:metal transporter CNNM
MHADDHPQGHGELKHDTAAIIGHTLDLQEKVVTDAMTSAENV